MANFSVFKNIADTTFSRIDTQVKPKASNFNYSGQTFLSSLASVAQKKIAQTSINPVFTRPQVIKPPSLKKDVNLPVPNLKQGPNECGPTSLAMALQYYGVNCDQHTMFPSSSFGHGPLALKEFAEKKNMTVRQVNEGSNDNLKTLIDMGIPVMVLGIYGGGENKDLDSYIDNAKRAHWMTVTGYKTDDAGNITDIRFNNPNTLEDQCWSKEKFENEFWKNNIIPGGHRYMMAMAPRGSYKEKALKLYLPNDKTSMSVKVDMGLFHVHMSFKDILATVDGLEDAAYYAEKTANDVADFVEDTANDIADAWETVTGWFS